MTTIAYKSGVIAYDSQMTAGEVISDLNFNKQIIKDGHRFFFGGVSWLCPKFIESYFAGKNLIKLIDENVDPQIGALIVDPDGLLFESAIDQEDVLWLCEVDLNSCTALGSGSPFALTAMDMGATAKQAVAMAAKRDLYTGGKIRTFEVPGYKAKTKKAA